MQQETASSPLQEASLEVVVPETEGRSGAREWEGSAKVKLAELAEGISALQIYFVLGCIF